METTNAQNGQHRKVITAPSLKRGKDEITPLGEKVCFIINYCNHKHSLLDVDLFGIILSISFVIVYIGFNNIVVFLSILVHSP